MAAGSPSLLATHWLLTVASFLRQVQKTYLASSREGRVPIANLGELLLFRPLRRAVGDSAILKGLGLLSVGETTDPLEEDSQMKVGRHEGYSELQESWVHDRGVVSALMADERLTEDSACHVRERQVAFIRLLSAASEVECSRAGETEECLAAAWYAYRMLMSVVIREHHSLEKTARKRTTTAKRASTEPAVPMRVSRRSSVANVLRSAKTAAASGQLGKAAKLERLAKALEE